MKIFKVFVSCIYILTALFSILIKFRTSSKILGILQIISNSFRIFSHKSSALFSGVEYTVDFK